jgi:hypothetical protein
MGTTIVGMRTIEHVVDDVKNSDGQHLQGELIARLRDHRWDRQLAPWSD